MANLLITIKNIVSGDKEVKSLGQSLTELKSGIDLAKEAAGAAAEVFQQAWDLSKEGAQLNDLTASFERMNAEVFKTPNLLQDMVAATNNTISQADAMKGILTLSAGATDSAAQAYAAAAPRLLEIAKASNKLNPSLGDTAFLFDSLALGIKRGSPMILDNLGLQIKLGAANEEYAKALGKSVEQLTAEEKTMALLNATMAAGDQLINQVGGNVDAQADSWAQLEVQITDTGNALKQAFADRLIGVVGGTSDAIDAVTESTDKGRSAWLNAAIVLTEFTSANSVGGKALREYVQEQKAASDESFKLTNYTNALADSYAAAAQNLGGTADETETAVQYTNALANSYAAAGQAAVESSNQMLASIEATKAHQQAITEAFKDAANPIQDLLQAQSELIAQRAELEGAGDTLASVYTGDIKASEEARAAIEAAEAAIRDQFRQTAAEAILARDGINQANLDLLVSIGYLSQEEANARLAFAETQVAIEELTASQEFQKLTTEQQAVALNSLIEGQVNTADAALRAGEQIQKEGESVEELRNRLVATSGTYTAAVNADTSAAEAAVQRLRDLISSVSSGATQVTSAVGSQLAANAAAASAGNRAAGGPVLAGEMYRAGEGNRPEILATNSGLFMIPGDNGRVFSNSDSKQMMGGGNNIQITIHQRPGEDSTRLGNKVASMVADKIGGLN